MTKPKNMSNKSVQARTIGYTAFAAISAVEGLKLNSTSEKRLQNLRSSNMTANEKRKAVISAYTNAKSMNGA